MNPLWRWRLIASLLVAGALPTVPFALGLPEAAVLPTEIERRLEQALDIQRARSAERSGVMSSRAGPSQAKLDLPTEAPCFSLGHRHYIGRAVLDIGAGVRGTQADPYVTGYA